MGCGRCLQILGVSVDSQFSHLAWIQTGKRTPPHPHSLPSSFLGQATARIYSARPTELKRSGPTKNIAGPDRFSPVGLAEENKAACVDRRRGFPCPA